MIRIIFIIKIAEFDHVLCKQRGDSRGEAATSCASSQIVQSLTHWVERMTFAFSLFVDICRHFYYMSFVSIE